MPRRASLFLPNLAIERIRRDERRESSGEEIPLATTARSANRILLADVSPAAVVLGLAPGMALTQARALVPALEVREADPDGDAAWLARLGLLAARRWTPRASVSGPDGLFLDLTGVAHLFGGEERMCARVLAFCARLGFTARIAVAESWGAAHALARFGESTLIRCPAGGEAEALAPMPIDALRVGEETAAAARRLGLEQVGDLIAMPRGPLQRRFGATLLAGLDRALGRAGEAIDPIVPEEAPAVLLRFLEPIATAEAIAAAIEQALVRLVGMFEEKGLAARLLLLACERVDGRVETLRAGTARATRDGAHLLRLLEPRIEELDPGFGFDSLRLTALRVEPSGPRAIEGALTGEPPPADLVPLIDRLAARLGARRLYRTRAVESDVPERSVRRTGPLGETVPWPSWPRPVRLLVPPERIEGVVALLPDQPPRLFTWRGRSYRVAAADGPERIYGEWWKRTCEADAVRDYFQVEDEEGRRFWLYRRGDGVDARTGDLSWYLQGLFG